MNNNGKTKKARGRPAKGRDPSITIRLPGILLAWIDMEAVNTEVSRSEMILRLIEESRLGVPADLRRIRTAYHEAGHAVVARALGIQVIEVTIISNENSLGSVLHEVQPQIMFFETDVIETQLMLLMAGRVAEQMVLGFFHDDGGDRADQRRIKRLFKLYRTNKGATAKEELEILRDKTVSLVMIDLKK